MRFWEKPYCRRCSHHVPSGYMPVRIDEGRYYTSLCVSLTEIDAGDKGDRASVWDQWPAISGRPFWSWLPLTTTPKVLCTRKLTVVWDTTGTESAEFNMSAFPYRVGFRRSTAGCPRCHVIPVRPFRKRCVEPSQFHFRPKTIALARGFCCVSRKWTKRARLRHGIHLATRRRWETIPQSRERVGHGNSKIFPVHFGHRHGISARAKKRCVDVLRPTVRGASTPEHCQPRSVGSTRATTGPPRNASWEAIGVDLLNPAVPASNHSPSFRPSLVC